jgi:hypothetical protein
MDIVMPPGSKKVTLTSQRPMLRVVIQDAMENLRADLLFKHAFPDLAVALVTVKDSLLTCASCYPGALLIYRHLLFDDQYMAAITPLVSPSMFRGNVTNAINSHVLGFHFSEAKSKSSVLLLYRQSFLPSLL